MVEELPGARELNALQPRDIVAQCRRTGEHQSTDIQIGKLEAKRAGLLEEQRELIRQNMGGDDAVSSKRIKELAGEIEGLQHRLRPLNLRRTGLREERARRLNAELGPRRLEIAREIIAAAGRLRAAAEALIE